MSKEDPLLMKPRTTIPAAILGLTILVSGPAVGADTSVSKESLTTGEQR